MTQPDGNFTLFNDSAFNGASSVNQLLSYASRIGIPLPEERSAKQIHFPDSGYLRRAQGNATIFLDVGPIGPDYIPGHAHADSLGFAMSLGTQRVFVDTGTSAYETGRVRQKERSTSAHNTVEIDNANSSDVWGSFRVARRARSRVITIDDDRVVAEHNGYTRFRDTGIHRREWTFLKDEMRIVDEVGGTGHHKVVSRLHIHPTLNCVTIDGLIKIRADEATIVTVRPDEKTAVRLTETHYSPEFGSVFKNSCIQMTYLGTLPARLSTRISW